MSTEHQQYSPENQISSIPRKTSWKWSVNTPSRTTWKLLTCMEDRIATFADHFKAEELHSAGAKIEAPFLVAEKNLSALPAVDAAMLSVF
jgi:hypothetical protein